MENTENTTAPGENKQETVNEAVETTPNENTEAVHDGPEETKPENPEAPKADVPTTPKNGKSEYSEYLLDIAKVAHQANRAFLGTLGDTSEKDWENLDERTKKETAEQVEFSLQNISVGAEAHHVAWMNEMTEKGYSAGDLDEANKKHPLLVPFAELPEENKKQHKLFFAIVEALK